MVDDALSRAGSNVEFTMAKTVSLRPPSSAGAPSSIVIVTPTIRQLSTAACAASKSRSSRLGAEPDIELSLSTKRPDDSATMYDVPPLGPARSLTGASSSIVQRCIAAKPLFARCSERRARFFLAVKARDADDSYRPTPPRPVRAEMHADHGERSFRDHADATACRTIRLAALHAHDIIRDPSILEL